MRKWLPAVLLILLIPTAHALSFSIKDSCGSGETVLFSISNETNAHVAEPSFYQGFTGSNGENGKQVCATGIDSARIVQDCGSIGNPVLSFYDSESSVTHLSAVDERHDQVLCSDSLATSVWRTCPGDSKPIVSIYDPVENHIAKPGFYQWQICGASFDNITLAYEFTMSGNKTFIANLQEGAVDTQETVTDLPGYVAVQNDSVMSGLVGGSDLPHIVGIRNNSGRAELNHTVQVSQGQWFLPFTTGDYFDIENRLDRIADDRFMSAFNPSFAFEIAENILVKVSLTFPNVDLVRSLNLGSGVHRLIVENIGTNSQGEPEVSINATT